MLGPSPEQRDDGFLELWPITSKSAEGARDAAIVWACAALFLGVSLLADPDEDLGALGGFGYRVIVFVLLLKAGFWAWRARRLPSAHTSLMTQEERAHSRSVRERARISCGVFLIAAIHSTVVTLGVISGNDIGYFIADMLTRWYYGEPGASPLACLWLWLVTILAWRRM